MKRFAGMLLLPLFLLFAGCAETVPAPRPDGAAALRHAEEIARIVPRNSGSKGAEKTVRLLKDKIRRLPGFRLETDSFRDLTPAGELVFRNVIATLPGRSKTYLVIGSHYDTKKLDSVPAFQGANDGASGNGAMLAMMEAFAKTGTVPPLTLVFVFFDGEEALMNYTKNDGLHGSRRFVRERKRAGKLADCRAMILLDMVGDRDLKLTLPSDTNPRLAEIIERSAKELGYEKYLSRNGPVMLDDHTPFVKAGVPAADLIDFSYGPENLYWHTDGDTMDKLSAESLGIASGIAMQTIWNLMKERNLK